ncbi:hypothetical protein LL946_17405 [Knoellia locipacati]|uniref:hypothetical protein n=1 Tax=Knoellia locipacati TaxID=882824 RepID=UPI00384DCDBA
MELITSARPTSAPDGDARARVGVNAVGSVALGGLCGLAWACGLRGFMAQVTTEPSNVTWTGTFVFILVPGLVTGLLLGWAGHLRHTSLNSRGRWLVLSPFVFAVSPLTDLVRTGATLQGGMGGGTLAVPAIGIVGGYALAGRRGWARVVCGLVALSVIPIWSLTATDVGGEALGLTGARGLWVALHYWTFLAILMVGCAVPLRIGRALPPEPSIAGGRP